MVAIFMVFIALTSAYIIRQDTGHIDFTTQTYVRDWRPLTLPPILLINSLILLLSSVTIEFARRSAFHEAAVLEDWLGISRQIAKRSLPWLLLTLMLGLGFLLGQFFAWQELRAAGVFMNTNPSHAFFYAFTGLHAVHLVGGILALFWAVISGFTARHVEQRQIAIDTTAWYWHGMGALWLYIYTLLYFAR